MKALKERSGPHPLSAHIGFAADLYAEKEPRVLEDMLRGIKRYQSCNIDRPQDNLKTVLQFENMRVLALGDYAPDEKPLLLIPSLINRSAILNLHKDRSLMRWLRSQRFAVYMIDWGELGQNQTMRSISSLIENGIGRALESLKNRHKAERVHGLGYCMGGTLLAGAASLFSHSFDRLIFLATPWGFSRHEGHDVLNAATRFWAPAALNAIHKERGLSSYWIQSLFASIDPQSTVRKFARFSKMDMDNLDAKIFVAVEDWLNDSVDLPADIARQCIRDWFLENKIENGQWFIEDHKVCTKNIENRSLILASSEDRLVSSKSSLSLYQQLGHKAEKYDPKCGHIGMIAGHEATQNVWEPIRQFLISDAV